MTPRKIVFRVFVYALAALILGFAVIPFLWTVITSLKDEYSVYAKVPTFIPNPVTLENYEEVLENPLMINYFRNTVIVAFAATVISLLIALFAAYGFHVTDFPEEHLSSIRFFL